MRVVILPSIDSVAQYSAAEITDLIHEKPTAVLGLATGSTPIACYKKLINNVHDGEISFADVTTFNLDEYIGIAPTHPQSYRHFMNQELFRLIDIKIENTHIPDGHRQDLDISCQNYEAAIKKSGGLDLQLLGIGENGHIGFNEPSSSLASLTRIKTLSPQTIKNNARFFTPNEIQPQLAITMGIGTIMSAKKIVLIATGDQKQQAVADLVEGPISAFSPASILQMHKNAIIVIDEAAAGRLKLRDYYLHGEAMRKGLMSI